MKLDIKFLNERLRKEYGIMYGSEGAAGIDLRACIDAPLVLLPNQVILISSGIAINPNSNQYAGLVIPRSGLGHKKGLVLGNLIGLIDSDYQGEIKISAWNRSNTTLTITPYERIAQLVIVPVCVVGFNIVDEFTSLSERGSNGFGSTGTD